MHRSKCVQSVHSSVLQIAWGTSADANVPYEWEDSNAPVLMSDDAVQEQLRSFQVLPRHLLVTPWTVVIITLAQST